MHYLQREGLGLMALLGFNWKHNFHLVIYTIFFSQPGCVNTTEMDIRKCRRLKNPQKVKKVCWFS